VTRGAAGTPVFERARTPALRSAPAAAYPSSESFTGGGSGGGGSLSEQEQAGVNAAIEAACDEEAIESEECQAIIESLFGPQD